MFKHFIIRNNMIFLITVMDFNIFFSIFFKVSFLNTTVYVTLDHKTKKKMK